VRQVVCPSPSATVYTRSFMSIYTSPVTFAAERRVKPGERRHRVLTGGSKKTAEFAVKQDKPCLHAHSGQEDVAQEDELARRYGTEIPRQRALPTSLHTSQKYAPGRPKPSGGRLTLRGNLAKW
jgi:hypothetical protein